MHDFMIARIALRAAVLIGLCLLTSAFRTPERAPLPNFDKRTHNSSAAIAAKSRQIPDFNVTLDPVTESAVHVTAKFGFLTGANGYGGFANLPSLKTMPANDSNRVTKAFIQQHREIFGHGADALNQELVQRDVTRPHSGLRSVVWQQSVNGIPVFDGLFVANTTAKGYLVSLSSRFVSDDAHKRAKQEIARSAPDAVRLASENLQAPIKLSDISAKTAAAEASAKQSFGSASLIGDAGVELTWFPMSKSELRLCWNVVLKPKLLGQTYQLVVDANSGEVLLRRRITLNLTDVTYRVFTSDSPSPFSPGHPLPSTNQPARVGRDLVTFSAISTNASPAGWIADSDNQTVGNNVDAHRDADGNDVADLPRPSGSPFRVFDPTLDLSQPPSSSGNAAVVQLFYWCNWAHDKLYDLGFTEGAGNFQANNFGRGGASGDPVLADSQDGADFNNADIDVLPDGVSPRMQMYLFSGPSPDIDGSLDAEIVLHEYVHGLSTRLVGGGNALFALQSGGMGEGWSDFYAMALLCEPGDDLHGN